ncbi:hypothetical protein V6N11_052435 [Hibiscus sabdariffa]|uniref:Clathrin interactor EPSIN 3 n=1 Tax=Hibiscus sabdariffa TaxID=183260 RepID=A0ABR2UA12_9ROSI
MYRQGSGGYGDRYDYDHHGSMEENQNGNGRDREYGCGDDDRYGRYGDSNGRDRDRHGRDYEDHCSRDGYKDNDYRGRSVDGDQYGTRSRGSDRDRAFDDDGSSSQGSGARVDDHSQDGRQLEQKFPEQNIGAPPSFEEALMVHTAKIDDRDGEISAAAAPMASSASNIPNHVAFDFDNSASPPDQKVEAFDEFDPRSSVPGTQFSGHAPTTAPSVTPTPAAAVPTASSYAEIDLLGDLSGSLAIVPTTPTIPSGEADTSSHSGAIPSFAADQFTPNFGDQGFDYPFGDSPFKAFPSNDVGQFQQQISTSMPTFQPTTNQNVEVPQPPSAKFKSITDFNFGDTFSADAYSSSSVSAFQPPLANSQFFPRELSTPNQESDLLADILPPSGPAYDAASHAAFSAPTNQSSPPIPTYSQSAQQDIYGQQTQSGANMYRQPTQSSANLYGQPAQPSASPHGQSGQPSSNGYAALPNAEPPKPDDDPYGQPAQTNASPYGQLAQPNANPYGQPAQPNASPYGQPAQPNVNPYGQLAQPNANPNGQLALVNANPHGQPAQPNGQPAQQNANPYGQPALPNAVTCVQPALPNAIPYVQPTLPNTNPNGQPAQPNANPNGQPTWPNAVPYVQPAQRNAVPYVQPAQPNANLYGQPIPLITNPTDQPAQENSNGQPAQPNANQYGQPSQPNTNLNGQLTQPNGNQYSQLAQPNTNPNDQLAQPNANLHFQPVQTSSNPYAQPMESSSNNTYGNFNSQTVGPQSSVCSAPNRNGSFISQVGSNTPFSSHVTAQPQNPAGSAAEVNTGNFIPQQGSGMSVASQSANQIKNSPGAQDNNSVLGGLFLQPVSTTSILPQTSPLSTGELAIVPQPSNKKFEPKSAVWADTLSRGLVNLNISGPKANPLADIGIDFDDINRKEKRLEKPAPSTVKSTVTMGKAMGSGSGIGRVGASVLRPPATPMMGSSMGMGMVMGMNMGNGSGPVGSMGMGGYGGMNQQPMGMGMNNMSMNPGMGGYSGMGMHMGMVQGAHMQPQTGMSGSYNPMMGSNGNSQQPYGGSYR